MSCKTTRRAQQASCQTQTTVEHETNNKRNPRPMDLFIAPSGFAPQFMTTHTVEIADEFQTQPWNNAATTRLPISRDPNRIA